MIFNGSRVSVQPGALQSTNECPQFCWQGWFLGFWKTLVHTPGYQKLTWGHLKMMVFFHRNLLFRSFSGSMWVFGGVPVHPWFLKQCDWYIILEPNWPLFLRVNPPKQGLFQSKQGSFGFKDHIWQSCVYEWSQIDLHFPSIKSQPWYKWSGTCLTVFLFKKKMCNEACTVCIWCVYICIYIYI